MISMMIKNMLMTFKSMTKVHQRHYEGDFNDDQEHADDGESISNLSLHLDNLVEVFLHMRLQGSHFYTSILFI